MNTVTNLLKDCTRVYVFLSSENVCSKFLSDAENEGFRFGNGVKPTKVKKRDIVYAIDNGLNICYVGFAGHMRLNSGDNGTDPRIIDYAKYMTGCSDIYYRK